ncbi:MAG: ABC transporter substrate-binding protein [Nitriliruptor sp.]
MLVAAAALLAACTADGAPPQDPPSSAPPEDEPDPTGSYCDGSDEGTLHWALDVAAPDGDATGLIDDPTIATWVHQGVLEGFYGATSTSERVPELLAADAEVTEGPDGTVTITAELREGLTWSDGEPLTAESILGTLELLRDGLELPVDPLGPAADASIHELIDLDSWEAEGSRFSFTMERFHPGWHTVFDRILPVHVLPDVETAARALVELEVGGTALPASGPFVFQAWEPGQGLTLARNGDYHGANPDHPEVENPGTACVADVEVLWVGGPRDALDALIEGEADLVHGHAAAGASGGAEPFTVEVVPGPRYETWSLDLDDRHLADPAVREALAFAIDKPAAIGEVVRPVVGRGVSRGGLGATMLLPDHPAYEDLHAAEGYGAGDHDAAALRLEAAGYGYNAEGAWEHPERGPLELRIASIGRAPFREALLTRLVDDLNRNGWSITAGEVEGASIVQHVAFGVAGQGMPGGLGAAAGAGLSDVDGASADIEACGVVIDEDARVGCLQDVDRRLVTLGPGGDGLAVFPLTQTPPLHAYTQVTVTTVSVATTDGPLAGGADLRLVPG